MNKVEILYEDNHILVVVKPPNILSQADQTKDSDMLTILKDYLREKYHKPGNVYLGLVHRLDRPVGGIMVFAKTSKAASRLCDQISKSHMKKQYLAIVHGIMEPSHGSVVNYIVKKPDNSSKITVKQEGKLAQLNYQVLEENVNHNLSLVDIDLLTGRHHQIRVQFANLGHFLYGDNRYGKKENHPIALYAYHLSFLHPTTKKVMEFTKYPSKNGVWSLFKSVK